LFRCRPDDKEDIMATKLEKALKREVDIEGKPYMLTIAPEGLKLVEKGRRNGLELGWKEMLSGDAGTAAVRAGSGADPEE
jgi:hypothetical protein